MDYNDTNKNKLSKYFDRNLLAMEAHAGNIIEKRLMSFALKKASRNNPSCKLFLSSTKNTSIVYRGLKQIFVNKFTTSFFDW